MFISRYRRPKGLLYPVWDTAKSKSLDPTFKTRSLYSTQRHAGVSFLLWFTREARRHWIHPLNEIKTIAIAPSRSLQGESVKRRKSGTIHAITAKTTTKAT